MLIPRRVKHRKQHHPNRSGAAKGGTKLAFGDYGIQALESSYLTNRQIESARIAMTRHIKRGGKVWINVYPDRPMTKHPAESRMGSGKGSPEWWIANIKPGRVLFELSGVDEPVARVCPGLRLNYARLIERALAQHRNERLQRSVGSLDVIELAGDRLGRGGVLAGFAASYDFGLGLLAHLERSSGMACRSSLG